MASNSSGLRIGIQILLGIVIIGLAYFLYVSITEPWAIEERKREMTQMTRQRMDKVRTALIRHERQQDRFPSSIDSLIIWTKQDSLLSLRTDSIFGVGFMLDSLKYSPRTGNAFEYSVNDTGRVAIYLLKDPDSNDQIGDELPDVTQINAASWE